MPRHRPLPNASTGDCLNSLASGASWPEPIDGAGILTLRWLTISGWRTCAALPGASIMSCHGETYRPAIGGEPAHASLIVPAVDEYGRIVDLVACTLAAPHRMRSRYGAAAIVGFDEVERAREADAPLLVFDNTIRWLYARSRGAVVIDWEKAPREIEGVTIILCAEGWRLVCARQPADAGRVRQSLMRRRRCAMQPKIISGPGGTPFIVLTTAAPPSTVGTGRQIASRPSRSCQRVPTRPRPYAGFGMAGLPAASFTSWRAHRAPARRPLPFRSRRP